MVVAVGAVIHETTRPLVQCGASPRQGADSCIALFLAAALRPNAPGHDSLDAALFARGAVDAAARHTALGRLARVRLDRAWLRRVACAGRPQPFRWRRALRALDRTPRGRALRRGGEEALRAWLRGDPPAPRLSALLHDAAR
jgi:hypothetical protein